MRFHHVCLALAAVLLAAAPTAAQEAPEPDALPGPDSLALAAPLPVDPDVRTGVLANGLTYYVRRNTEPENRAELRLAINAGSILEDEDQRGLAHFLEHMLFNGTRRFPEGELVEFLESTGMEFGPHVNAYTSFDETVYMLQIPTDSAAIEEQAFDVLEDWAAYATLDPEEIEKERGVVLAELRQRYETVGGRMMEATLPVVFKDSRYAERVPGGLAEVIQNAPVERVRDFYETWYRPELMSVVAVGDFDPDRYVAFIDKHFAHLENPADPAPRPTFDVPEQPETRTLVFADPEFPYTTVSVSYQRGAEEDVTVGDYREDLVSRLFYGMLNDRFSEIARQPGAPFLGAGAGSGGSVRPIEEAGLSARVHEDSVLTGLRALLTEAERVRRHGFTETELERQKGEVLRSYERLLTERENLPSASFAREYVANALEAEPIPGVRFEAAVAERYVPSITLGEVNALAEELLAERNRIVQVNMPEKEGLVPPTEKALAEAFETVQRTTIAPYVDAVSDEPLVADVPPPAPVAATERIDALDVTALTLANGVRVLMKPTDFKEDEVRFTAFSPGGTSVVDEARLPDADAATAFAQQSGVGAFDRTALQKKLSGKVVSVAPYVSELEEGFRGSASPDDLDELFQLIHLYAVAPRFNPGALAVFKSQLESFLVNRAANPNAVFSDSITAALYGDHPRRRPLTMQTLAAMEAAEAEAVYRERFSDFDDWTFIFVGNFEPERLTDLAQTYLGTLPTDPADETWRDVAPDRPEGVTEVEVRKGIGDQSRAQLVFYGPFGYERQERLHLEVMADVLRMMLREELREERGAVYGVGVNASASDRPDSTYSISISFTTDPDTTETLIDAVFEQIAALQTEGPSEEHLQAVLEQQRRGRETALRTNNFWLSQLDYYAARPGLDAEEVLRFEELLGGVTAEDVREAAGRYLQDDRLLRAILYPEAFAEGE